MKLPYVVQVGRSTVAHGCVWSTVARTLDERRGYLLAHALVLDGEEYARVKIAGRSISEYGPQPGASIVSSARSTTKRRVARGKWEKM